MVFHIGGASLKNIPTPFLTHDRRGHFHRAMQMWSEKTAYDSSIVKNTQKYMEERITGRFAWKNFSGSFDQQDD